MTPKNFLIINRQAPYANTKPIEALDFILSFAANEQHVSLLFMGDGVLQLIDNKAPVNDFLASYKALRLYDINDVYVINEDLQRRGLEVDDLILKPKLLDHEQVKNIYSKQDIILSF